MGLLTVTSAGFPSYILKNLSAFRECVGKFKTLFGIFLTCLIFTPYLLYYLFIYIFISVSGKIRNMSSG